MSNFSQKQIFTEEEKETFIGVIPICSTIKEIIHDLFFEYEENHRDVQTIVFHLKCGKSISVVMDDLAEAFILEECVGFYIIETEFHDIDIDHNIFEPQDLEYKKSYVIPYENISYISIIPHNPDVPRNITWGDLE